MHRTLAAALGSAAVVLAACSSSSEDKPETDAALAPAPVELTVDQATSDPVKVGVIVTLSAVPGQGADALPGAEGAQVASFRLDLGGQPVELDVVDDGGTEEGARAAVEKLVNHRASGILAATTGDHLLPALEDAAAAETAVLLPYLRTDQVLPASSYVTGVSSEAVSATLPDVMGAHGLREPFVVTADGVTAPGVDAAEQVEFDGSNSDEVVGLLRRADRAGAIDSALIAGSATSQAQVVSRLQGAVTDLPLVLTPDALSPVFADQLQAFDGTTAARFVTVGVDASDATTLSAGTRPDAVASYFAALRLLSDRSTARDLLDSVPFSEVAGGADTLSHDAVVALVTAAVEAGSVSAPAVLSALEGLEVDAEDGLAGPALDFSAGNALDVDAVVELNATSQDPGVRPGLDATNLFWFAVPTRSG